MPRKNKREKTIDNSNDLSYDYRRYLGSTGRLWQRIKSQVFAEEEACHICGEFVDQYLPKNSAMSRTVDHIFELWAGGDPLDRNNCRLAHRSCNSSKSGKKRGRKASVYMSVDLDEL